MISTRRIRIGGQQMQILLIRVGKLDPNIQKQKTVTVFSIKFQDSRHAQLSIYAVFDEESDFQVKNTEFRRLGANI